MRARPNFIFVGLRASGEKKMMFFFASFCENDHPQPKNHQKSEKKLREQFMYNLHRLKFDARQKNLRAQKIFLHMAPKKISKFLI